MKIGVKLIPCGSDGKAIIPPCEIRPQFQVDLVAMAEFATLRRTGQADSSDQEIALMLRMLPRVFSEMYGVQVIEISLPSGQIGIFDGERTAGTWGDQVDGLLERERLVEDGK